MEALWSNDFGFLSKDSLDQFVKILVAAKYTRTAVLVFLDEFRDGPNYLMAERATVTKWRDGEPIATYDDATVKNLFHGGRPTRKLLDSLLFNEMVIVSTMPTIRHVYRSESLQTTFRIDTFKCDGKFWTTGSVRTTDEYADLSKTTSLGLNELICRDSTALFARGKLHLVIRDAPHLYPPEYVKLAGNRPVTLQSFTMDADADFPLEHFDEAVVLARMLQMPLADSFAVIQNRVQFEAEAVASYTGIDAYRGVDALQMKPFVEE
jgi:hypothetical protein